MLETMERNEGRRVLIDVLAELGKQRIGLFSERLTHRSSNVVRDMLAIIDRIDPPNKIDLYAKCLEHPNVVIRIETMKVLAKAPGERPLKYLEKATADEDIQIRMTAYRALTQKSPKHAVPVLRKLMRADDYTGRDKREQQTIAVALGECKNQEALDFFASVFESKGNIFNRAKHNEVKVMAIRGLLAMRNVAAFQVLAREVQNRGNSKDVIEAAHKAALRLKAELTGQPVDQPEQ
jgi:hypothetical protein